MRARGHAAGARTAAQAAASEPEALKVSFALPTTHLNANNHLRFDGQAES
jgi:hypothetical protein